MIFGDLKLEDFKSKINKQNGNLILYNDKTGAVIDRAIQSQIANTLRKIHHFEKNIRKPANPEAKEYMLRRAREKMRRRKNRVVESQLEGLIVALVNNKEFKYNFEEVLDLSIYQFNESMRQVIKKVDFDNTMHGIYSGTVNAKDLSQDQLNWLIHK